MEGGFSFKLWDGANSGARNEFKVKVNQLSLQEKVNEELLVFPGTDTIITREDLLVTTDMETQVLYCMI